MTSRTGYLLCGDGDGVVLVVVLWLGYVKVDYNKWLCEGVDGLREFWKLRGDGCIRCWSYLFYCRWRLTSRTG